VPAIEAVTNQQGMAQAGRRSIVFWQRKPAGPVLFVHQRLDWSIGPLLGPAGNQSGPGKTLRKNSIFWPVRMAQGPTLGLQQPTAVRSRYGLPRGVLTAGSVSVDVRGQAGTFVVGSGAITR